MIARERERERERVRVYKFQGTYFSLFDFLTFLNILNVAYMICFSQPHTPFILIVVDSKPWSTKQVIMVI
jgi:hypothetical protein